MTVQGGQRTYRDRLTGSWNAPITAIIPTARMIDSSAALPVMAGLVPAIPTCTELAKVAVARGAEGAGIAGTGPAMTD